MARLAVAILACVFFVAISGQIDPVGSSKDAHNCIPSAGYMWCEREQECVRPWELSQSKNIENSVKEVNKYCSLKRGSNKDDHGCISSAGYMWCEAEEKCVRPWELAKERGFEVNIEVVDGYCNGETRKGGDADEHGCISSAGYMWCASQGACVRGWELARDMEFEFNPENIAEFCKEKTIVGEKKDHDCIPSAGYLWCEVESKCVRPWELANELNIDPSVESINGYCNGEKFAGKAGGDRDEHGCIHTAGYQWCKAENSCVRQWELARDKAFENTAEKFVEYCNRPIHGSHRDDHGCITSAGYMWCGKEQKCVRPWELASEKEFELSAETLNGYCNGDHRAGSDADDHGCIHSAGYSWCDAIGACVRGWELSKEMGFEFSTDNVANYCNKKKHGGDKDAHGCIGSAGFLWCEKEKNCVRPWELAKEQNFDLTTESISGYCDGTSAVGSSKDDHGCIASAGYTWCEKENACVRGWELAKDKEFDLTAENLKAYCSS